MSTNVLVLLGQPELDAYSQALRTRFPDIGVRASERASDIADHCETADALLTIGWKMNDGFLQRCPKLRWIQSVGVGVDGIVNQPSLRPDVVVTNVRNIHAAPVSEVALSLMLGIARDQPRLLRNQKNKVWERFQPRLLFEKKVGIVGVGAIATALAARCVALGMTAVGISSAPRKIDGFSHIFPKTELLKAVTDLDYLVLLTPHTPETHHMISSEVFAAMKPSSVLINVSRGGVVDEAAMVTALKSGAIAAAGLDVFGYEPLPEDSEIWSLPNVIVSPHIGGIHENFVLWNMRTIEANFQAFLKGETGSMINVVAH